MIIFLLYVKMSGALMDVVKQADWPCFSLLLYPFLLHGDEHIIQTNFPWFSSSVVDHCA